MKVVHLVDGSSRTDEVRDVCDVDADLEVSVGELAGVEGVVDVGAAGGVDGADVEVAAVDPALLVGRRDLPGHLGEAVQNGLAEGRVRDVVLQQQHHVLRRLVTCS